MLKHHLVAQLIVSALQKLAERRLVQPTRALPLDVLTTQTNVRPMYAPDLKNSICTAMHMARFSPACESIASSAPSVNVIA
jgi:hypothetical protein